MRLKKLIYVLNSYSEKESSHFHHVLNLLESLASRGLEIALVIEKADTVPVFSSRNIQTYTLKRRSVPFRLVELFTVLRTLIRQGFTRTFVRIAAPAVLTATLAHCLYGGAAFFWQSGTTIEFDAAQPLSMKKIRWYLNSHLPNTLARRWVQYFVTGPAFMVDYYARVGGVKRDKIRMLYNDIAIERFASFQDREREAQKTAFLSARGLPPGTLILLLVHRLSPVRRTELYFPACLTHLRDVGVLDRVLVLIAGGGPELPDIQEKVQALGLSARCIFMGSVPNREIHRVYSLADIFLHPTYNEGFPRVVIEAMAAGLPIVSTDAGGTRELVGELQSNLIVSRDDAQAFARCLAQLIGDSPLRQKLSVENLSHVERFSTEKVAAMYEEVLFS